MTAPRTLGIPSQLSRLAVAAPRASAAMRAALVVAIAAVTLGLLGSAVPRWHAADGVFPDATQQWVD